MPNIPLSAYIPTEYLPDFFKGLVNNVVFKNEEFVPTETGWNLNLTLGLANSENDHPFNLTFPSADSPIAVSFQQLTTLTIAKIYEDYALRYNPAQVDILLPAFLKNVTVQGNKLVASNSGRATINIALDHQYIEYNTFNGINFITPDFTSFDPVINTAFLIGNTGIGFSLQNLIFEPNQDGVDIQISNARVYFPESLGLIPDIEINQGTINQKGFSGELKFDWDLTFDEPNKTYKMNGQPVSLFGDFTGGLDFFAVTFENNAIKASNITGELLIPYFEGNRDTAVQIAITINDAGDFTVIAKSATGNDITLTKDELLKLHVQSLEIYKQEQTVGISISGGLEPLLYSSEGMKWPRMDVKNLKIDSAENFSIDEAWLNLKDMATLDLFGFHLELRKIGIGTLTDTNESNLLHQQKLWVDLSGGLKLIEQIPIGVDVEGFRVIWPQNTSDIPTLEGLAQAIGIQFKGVQLSFGVPGAIQLDGLIRFFKDAQATGFAGDMVLVIPPAGIMAEAGLMVGMNTKEPDPFPFFYVYFGLEAAAGIPLGQSGLALKGALGLFGINVEPNRLPEQNWYYDWYKKAPAPGAHQTTKWKDERNALAVGAGLTITTVDGVVKGTKGVIVLALPGPILVINGKALILDGLNPNPNAEPPFSVTAIFDGREKIVQFNIEAQAEIVKDVVDASAGVEAFFDFKDVTNWHLYLGQDEPRDRRIKANVLNIIEADAYLMLDMLNANSPMARMGIEVNVKPKIDNICFDIPIAGEQCITFDAHINLGGNGVVSVQPEQFSGDAFMDAGIEIKGLGLELEIGARADLSVEGPSPFSLKADLDLHANLPDPLPDYEDTFHYELTIPKIELDIKDPLTSVSLFSRFTSESKGLVIEPFDKITDLRTNLEYLRNSVIAECDINPILSFEHEMNQENNNFIMHPGGTKTYDVGAIRFTPKLKNIIIREKQKNGNSDWKIIYSTIAAEKKPIIGAWIAENDPSSPSAPASRRLQLMTTNPLTNTMHSTGMMGYLMMQTEADKTHLSEQILADYPDLMTCVNNVSIPTCVFFNYLGKPLKVPTIEWGNLVFSSPNEIIIKQPCLSANGELNISFPESVVSVTIEFCNPIEKPNIKVYSKPKGQELANILRENKKSNKTPETGCSKLVKNNIVYTSDGVKITVDKTSFDCIKIQSSDKSGLSIQSICYVTEQAIIDTEKNKSICDSNKSKISPAPSQPTTSVNPFVDNNIFKPGCYYEIEVLSELHGEVLNIGNKIEDSIIEMLYQVNLDKIQPLTSKYAYFQTEAPPQNLEPYIKWSIPSLQQCGVYTSDPITVRFKRGYINTLFGNNVPVNYRIRVFLKNSKGELIEINSNRLSWQSADSSTLFPDEQTWKSHLTTNQIQSNFKKDDILSIDFANLPFNFYLPNNRYELFLIGTEQKDIINDEIPKNRNVVKINDGKYYAVLSSKIFTTSKFTSFHEFINSGLTNSSSREINPSHVIGKSVPFNNTFNNLTNQWIDAEIEYHKKVVDYEYGIAKAVKGQKTLVSKEAVEFIKLKLRDIKDRVDEEFTRIALAINSDLLFTDTENKIKLYAIHNLNNKIEYLWLKLPEIINLKKVKNSTINWGNITIDALSESNATLQKIYNTDSSQIIFKFNTPIELRNVTNIKLEISFDKDSQDDISNTNLFGDEQKTHHRYDRPSLKGVSIETIEIALV